MPDIVVANRTFELSQDALDELELFQVGPRAIVIRKANELAKRDGRTSIAYLDIDRAIQSYKRRQFLKMIIPGSIGAGVYGFLTTWNNTPTDYYDLAIYGLGVLLAFVGGLLYYLREK